MTWRGILLGVTAVLSLTFSLSVRADEHAPIANQDQLIYQHANTKGLIFFFRGDCPYCKQFAPVLKHVERLYQFNTIAVSLDGSRLSEYPNAQSDHILGTRLGVTHVPAVYMVNPDTNTVSSVAFGFSSYAEFQDQIVFAGQMIDRQGAKQ